MSFGGSGGGSSSIQGASDVFLSNPGNGQVLTYDSGTLKWVNGAIPVNAANVSAALADISSSNLVTWSGSSWPARPDVPWPITYTGPTTQQGTIADMRAGDMWKATD